MRVKGFGVTEYVNVEEVGYVRIDNVDRSINKQTARMVIVSNRLHHGNALHKGFGQVLCKPALVCCDFRILTNKRRSFPIFRP